MDKKVCIMMATYNGEKYLREQLNSLIGQTYVNWVLYINDDNSTDSTVAILTEYKKKYPDKIVTLKPKAMRLGAKLNYGYLIHNVKGYDYYFFCDQDDVWHKDKIRIMIEFMKQYEKDKYLVLYHDMKVVDEKLESISESYRKFTGLRLREKKVFAQLLTYNFVAGCSMVFNNNVREVIEIFPENCIMHDWWILLVVASMGGDIIYLEQNLSLYRQHLTNEIGVLNGHKIFDNLRKMLRFSSYSNYRKNNIRMKNERLIQARELLDLYSDIMRIDNEKLAEEYCELITSKKKFNSLYKAYKYGFVFWNIIYTLKFYLI